MYIPHSTYGTVMDRALDAAAKRQEVLANNIANIDTPNFKRSDVTFESQLAIALRPPRPVKLHARRTDPRHFDFEDRKKIQLLDPKPYIVRELDTEYRNDKNNVDPDFEAAELAKNTMHFSALAQIRGNKLKGLDDLINRLGGGGR